MDCAPHFQYIQTLLEIVPISEATPFFLSCSTVIWQTVVAIIYNSRKGPARLDKLATSPTRYWKSSNRCNPPLSTSTCFTKLRRSREVGQEYFLGTTEGRSKIRKKWPEDTISTTVLLHIMSVCHKSHISGVDTSVGGEGGGLWTPYPIEFCFADTLFLF